MQARGSQRRDLCRGHRVLVLARARARVRAHERRPALRSRWQGPVRFIVRAISAPIFSRAPSRARAPCRAHARTTPSEKAAAHGRRSHAAAPRSQVPSGTQRRSTCARIGRLGMVAASGKAATTAHGRQRGDRAQSGGARLVPTSQLERGRAPYAHACNARFGRRFPRRAPPLWTPLPWHPLFLRNPQRGGALWLRGRSERRGRRRPLRLGGNGAAPRTPVRRPGRPAACIARVCWARLARGRHRGSADGALSVPRASALAGASALPLALSASTELLARGFTSPGSRPADCTGGSLRSPPAIVGPLPSNTWKTPPAIRPASRLARWRWARFTACRRRRWPCQLPSFSCLSR